MRVNSNGEYRDISVSQTAQSYLEAAMITNGDEGILITWLEGLQAKMAKVSGGSVQFVSAPVLGSSGQLTYPVLQVQDGSFVGGGYDANWNWKMIAFDAIGAIRWSVADKVPTIATLDGSIIATNGDGSAAVRNQSRNNTAHFRKDSKTNDKVREKLTPTFWSKFAKSHCASVIETGMSTIIPSYSLRTAQEKQAMTNFYDIGKPDIAKLLVREVTDGKFGSTHTLESYVGSGTAATPNMGFSKQTAIILKPSVLAEERPQFTLVHEIIFHAYAGQSDDSVFAHPYFRQQGLWRPDNSTASVNISTWLATDCKCTPGNSAAPPCQANTATW